MLQPWILAFQPIFLFCLAMALGFWIYILSVLFTRAFAFQPTFFPFCVNIVLNGFSTFAIPIFVYPGSWFFLFCSSFDFKDVCASPIIDTFWKFLGKFIMCSVTLLLWEQYFRHFLQKYGAPVAVIIKHS